MAVLYLNHHYQQPTFHEMSLSEEVPIESVMGRNGILGSLYNGLCVCRQMCVCVCLCVCMARCVRVCSFTVLRQSALRHLMLYYFNYLPQNSFICWVSIVHLVAITEILCFLFFMGCFALSNWYNIYLRTH